MSPTPRAAALLALAALSALILPGWAALAVVVGILAAAVTDAWMVRLVPEVEVDLPSILSRGIPAPITLSTGKLAPALRLRQPAMADLRIAPQEGDGILEAEITAIRRGRHRLPAPATRATGPLGLGWWFHRTGHDQELVVYPDLPAARHLVMEVRLGRFRGEGRRSRGPLGLGTELEAIREYSPDDDIRQVNWRATARMGHPMSNTYRVEQDREVVCLLDCGRLMSSPLPARAGRPPLTRLDAAVDAVAAMAAVADEIGDRIGVIAFDQRVIRQLSPRREGGTAVLKAIFDLEPAAVDSDYQLAFRSITHSKRAFVLILTDLLDETAARPLLEATPVLARHHAVAVASVSDPAVEQALALSEETLAGVFRQAVAVDVTEARESVSARLTGLGVRVIDSPPEQLSAACVAAYLAAKRRARL